MSGFFSAQQCSACSRDNNIDKRPPFPILTRHQIQHGALRKQRATAPLCKACQHASHHHHHARAFARDKAPVRLHVELYPSRRNSRFFLNTLADLRSAQTSRNTDRNLEKNSAFCWTDAWRLFVYCRFSTHQQALPRICFHRGFAIHADLRDCRHAGGPWRKNRHLAWRVNCLF